MDQLEEQIFPRGNHQDLLDSITKKLWPLGNDIEFISGHGPNSTFGHERQINMFVSDSASKYKLVLLVTTTRKLIAK